MAEQTATTVCPYNCRNGRYFDYKTKSFNTCPHCAGIYSTLTSKEPTEAQKEIFEELNIPEDFRGISFDPLHFYDKRVDRAFAKESMQAVLEKLSTLAVSIGEGKPLKESLYIHTSLYSRIFEYVYYCMQEGIKAGLTVAPFLSTMDLAEMREKCFNVREKYHEKYQQCVNAKIFFCIAPAYIQDKDVYILVDILTERARRALPTYVIGQWSTQRMGYICQTFKSLFDVESTRLNVLRPLEILSTKRYTKDVVDYKLQDSLSSLNDLGDEQLGKMIEQQEGTVKKSETRVRKTEGTMQKRGTEAAPSTKHIFNAPVTPDDKLIDASMPQRDIADISILGVDAVTAIAVAEKADTTGVKVEGQKAVKRKSADKTEGTVESTATDVKKATTETEVTENEISNSADTQTAEIKKPQKRRVKKLDIVSDNAISVEIEASAEVVVPKRKPRGKRTAAVEGINTSETLVKAADIALLTELAKTVSDSANKGNIKSDTSDVVTDIQGVTKDIELVDTVTHTEIADTGIKCDTEIAYSEPDSNNDTDLLLMSITEAFCAIQIPERVRKSVELALMHRRECCKETALEVEIEPTQELTNEGTESTEVVDNPETTITKAESTTSIARNRKPRKTNTDKAKTRGKRMHKARKKRVSSKHN